MNDAPGNSFEGESEAAEKDQIDQVCVFMRDLLDKRYTAANKKILRGVHPKSHGCVQATFEINKDIDPSLQSGLFSTPGNVYEAVIRFSNAAALVAPDMVNNENASRGMAVKVFAVDGDEGFLQLDDGARNQDFLMINTPSFAFVNIPDYLQLNKILLKNDDSADEFFAPFATPETCPRGVISAIQVIQQIKSRPVACPVEVQYFGAAPFAFGSERVMRFSAKPRVAPDQKAPENASPDYLKEALEKRLAGNEPIIYDFMIQVRNKGDEALDIEDATAVWDEAHFPFIPVAKITIAAPQADIYSPENEARGEDLVFSPWHSLAAHQPLGGINRLRKDVYTVSAEHRKTK